MIIHRVLSYLILPLMVAIFIMPKGTRLHKLFGKSVIVLMFISIGTAFINAIELIHNSPNPDYIFPKARVGILMAISLFSSIYHGMYFLRHHRDFKGKKVYYLTGQILAVMIFMASIYVVSPINETVAFKQYWLPRLIAFNLLIMILPYIISFKKRFNYELGIRIHQFYMINLFMLSWYSLLSTTASMTFWNKDYARFIFYNLPLFGLLLSMNAYVLWKTRKNILVFQSSQTEK